MKQNVLEKLEWRLLTQELAKSCRTKAGVDACTDLIPKYTKPQVEERWRLVEPLRQLIVNGYVPPLQDMEDLALVFRALKVGQILTGKDLRSIYNLLTNVKLIQKFCTDFGNKCQTLKLFHARTYPLPRILSEIEKTVGPDGELLDDASPELSRIRREKLSIRKKIESVLKGIFQDAEVVKYLQDDFFTIRSERYVVPIKLDGRGRIKGSIYDTSDSGQTLFIEPTVIAPLNEQLLEFELSEKLEILRIFRDLGGKINNEFDILKQNYEELIQLDILTAEALLAKTIDAGPIRIAESPVLKLRKARHPLLMLDKTRKVVENDIELNKEQRVLIISGPNAGGKTVVLKTVGLLNLMAKAGLLVPADSGSEVFLFEDFYLELGDAQNLTANLSTFSGHIMGLKPIVDKAGEQDLVLLDEIAAGTEPQTGSALAQSILEHLLERKALVVATTHFDALKTLAVSSAGFRNGSMEYSMRDLRPTFHLILDIPGQSYGIEVAEHLGLPKSILERAKGLRGVAANRMDQMIEELNLMRNELRLRNQELGAKAMELESAKVHWETEKNNLEEARRQASQQLSSRYEEMLSDLRTEYDELTDSMRKQLRTLEKRDQLTGNEREMFKDVKQQAQQKLSAMAGSVAGLTDKQTEDNDGQPPSYSELKEEMPIYVRSLKTVGNISRLGSQKDQPIEVRVGIMKVHVALEDLRLVTQKPKSQKSKSLYPQRQSAPPKGANIPFTPQSPTNAVDLRGMDVMDAVTQMWRFVDQSVLRGEARIVVIHGHGFNKLKNAIRDALLSEPPYKLSFRAGDEKEGGDGVTIVALDR